ncbi:sulfatase [Rhodopirellula sp.]|nr:sulfatase [Rhodopirellula sp.]MDB4678975.1 sulfatase [Rhodopirellula sp.]
MFRLADTPILLALTLLAIFGTPISKADDRSQENQKPNIVLIISDDQAWSDYSFMGHETIQTPNLDRLAKESVLFRRGYVPTSLCRPSLATLLTGHYASTHGITGNDPSPKHFDRASVHYKQACADLIAKIDRFKTVPALLQEQGYLSHQSGKLWEGSYKNSGFTHGMTRGFPNNGGRHGDDGLKIGREGLEPIANFLDLAKRDSKPFFLWYAPFLPHTPHNPPQRILAKYQTADRPVSIAKYYAMCDWFDETCGQLVDLVERRELAENTIFIYVTDNGWIQDPKSRKYAPRSKQSPNEGGTRTPIFFHWPKKFKANDRNDLVSSIDLVPTILSLAQAAIPSDLPGLDLTNNLRSGDPIERKQIFGEGFAHDIADIDKPEASLLYRWCIEGKWKLLLTYDGEVNRYASSHPRNVKVPQLFNLTDDPTEQTNLANSHPELVQRLSKAIANWYPVHERKTLTAAQ